MNLREQLAALLEDARRRPDHYRLSSERRHLYECDLEEMRKHGCNGPVVAALTRALLLDEETRYGI